MAELPEYPSTSSSPLDLRSKHLSLFCVSCGEKVEELKCLPCLHSLALCKRVECGKKVLHLGVSCEICKEVASIPPDGLPNHTFALRKALSVQYQKEGLICQEEHEEERAAVSYCSDCDAFICQECLDRHKTILGLKKHKPQSIESVIQEGGAKKDDQFNCTKHREGCKLYCHTCDEMICHICLSLEHHSHKVSFIDSKLGELNKTTLKQCLSSAKTQTKATCNALQEVQASRASLQQQSAETVEEIVEMKEHLIVMVTTQCDSLVAEVKKAEYKETRDLDKREKELKADLKKLEEFASLSKEMSLKGTTEEQLSVTKMVVARVFHLSAASPQPSSIIHPSVKMIRPSRGEVETKISSLGTICHKAHPPNCTLRDVELPHSWAKVKKPPKLVIETRDKKGNRCRGREKVLAVLRPVTAGVPVFGKVTDKRDGTYEVQFKSIPSEKYHLSVTVGGHDVAGSPVEVKALEYSAIATVKQEFAANDMQFCAVTVGPDGSSVYSVDDKNKAIVILTKEGQIKRLSQIGNKGYLYDIALTSKGNIYISNFNNHCIYMYTPAGELISQFGECGSKPGQLYFPMGLAVNKKGHLFVTELFNHRVSVFSEDGLFLYSFGSAGSGEGQFRYPRYLCIAPNGLVYITDNTRNNNRVQVFQQNGQFVRQFGNNIVKDPHGIAATSDGHIVVASLDANKVSIFTPDGQCVREVTDIGLNYPHGVAVDNELEGFIFVADDNNKRIVKL